MNGALFPRYTEFDPKVPVWCVTHDVPRCIHRFFDTSPFSPSGRYLAVFQFPFEDRLAEPGEAGNVWVIDLQEGGARMVATTIGWEAQLGANINWGGSDHELFFNDVDPQTWEPFAWKVDFLRGTRQRMGGPVYHASPDGRWIVSSDSRTHRLTQRGYGVVVPDEYIPRRLGLSDEDGFFLTDTHTGVRRLLLSTRTAFTQANPAIRYSQPERCEIYGFHSKFNPQGDRLMLSFRFFEPRGEPVFYSFRRRDIRTDFAWVTCRLDGSELACAVGPEEWEKGGHHATWFPDGRRISMNLAIDRDGLRLVEVEANGSGLRAMTRKLPGSGHPTVHRDLRHILSDTYFDEATSFGDGTVPLRWIDLETETEETLVRINSKQLSPERALRVDAHPAWDRTWRYVAFNAFLGGTRRVMVADLGSVIGEPPASG